ncbi:MAG TPA: ATP-binding cassette domain-containing protein, partial [Rubrobacter sp.]|nr:ATP-binding cassette domain-containing protein [Rubrobacter sp.]
ESGEIRIDGEEARIRSPQAAMERGIFYVPEERRSQGLILPFSIKNNITLSILDRISRFGFVPRAERQTADRFARDLSIRGADLSDPVSRLSGGNQQKVVLAKSLAREPSILLLDEPTRGIDVGAKSEIYRLIDKLAKEGKAILLISSELEEVLSMSDRVVVMREGEITGEFEGVDLTLRRGEIVGLAGLVGAGRTELAQAIFGIRAPEEGEILVHGEETRIRSPQAAMEKGVFYVPEERRSQGLILPFSIKNNITLSILDRISHFGFVPRSERQTAERFARELSIRGARISDPVIRLSGGNQQKVVVAKSLAREPSVLLLDEPTRGVDVGAKSEIYRLIDDLARDGMAILL